MSGIEWSGFRAPGIIYPLALFAAFAVAYLLSGERAAFSVAASGALCFVHLLSGFLILETSFERPPMTFLKRVLGGMGVRLGGMLLVLLGLIRSDAFDDSWLLLSLLFWYALALVFEIIALHHKAALSHNNE